MSHLAVLALKVLAVVLRCVPVRTWGWLAAPMTPILWCVLGTTRCRTVANLRAQGLDEKEVSRRGRGSFRSIILVLFETLALDRILARRGVEVIDSIDIESRRILDEIRTGKRNVAIAITAHSGSWEAGGAIIAALLKPAPMKVASRPQKNLVIQDYIFELRRRVNTELVHKDKVLRDLLTNHRSGPGALYVFVSDQHTKGGCKIPFMGRLACTVDVPAAVALKYDIPLLLCRCVREKVGRYRIEMERLDLTPFKGIEQREATIAVMKECNRYIERTIEMAPEQWTWGHRRWRDKCCGEPVRSAADSA